MSDVLKVLQHGVGTLCHDGPTTDILNVIPVELDMEKFDRGRQFFKKNLSGCTRSMFYSLVIGLSVNNLLDVLVATGETSKPKEAFRRYRNTVKQVVKWHYGDIWDDKSAARKSIMYVRNRHFKARNYLKEMEQKDPECFSALDRSTLPKKINEREWNHSDVLEKKSLFISQYDMSLVQAGFIGVIVMYPYHMGIRCTESELDDFVYVWRWIGYLLGIEDRNNICIDGYAGAYRICKAIQKEIILPSLTNPPENFEPMATAFLEGKSLATKRLVSYKLKPLVAVACIASRHPVPFKMSISDVFRFVVEISITLSVLYIPGVRYFLNIVVENVLQAK